MPKTVAVKTARKLPASLQQKMAQSVAGTSPTLVPAGMGGTAAPPPPKREEEVVPSIDEVMEPGEDRDTLRELVAKHATINGQIKPLEAALEPLKNRIKGILGSYGIGKMRCDSFSVNYFPSSRSTIDKTRLLAAGVSIETIEACTITTTSSTLKIGQSKE